MQLAHPAEFPTQEDGIQAHKARCCWHETYSAWRANSATRTWPQHLASDFEPALAGRRWPARSAGRTWSHRVQLWRLGRGLGWAR